MPQTKPALDLAFAPRGQVQIATSIKQDVPEIGLKKGKLDPIPKTQSPPPRAPAPKQ
jgi:hypothetical protein